MNLRILLFAGLADACGSTFLLVELPALSTVATLKDVAQAVSPALQTATFRVAVNSAYVDDEATIPENAEIAFLPPVSGG